MLFVLADDFSGAAEIAGIAYRFGLASEVQVTPELNNTPDVIVLDTDTRSLPEHQAIDKINEVAIALKKLKEPPLLFKKIDSVMRGHLIPEINVLQNHFHFNRILLLPANPNRGRKIVDGNYLINGTPLHETIFTMDPDFPVTASSITTRIGTYNSVFKHVHIKPGDVVPSSALVTGDVKTKDDLKRYLTVTTNHDLCCGAAELFEAFLENLGYRPTAPCHDKTPNAGSTLIINGSTVKNPSEDKWFQQHRVQKFALPERLRDATLEGSSHEMMVWQQQILSALLTDKIAAVSIDHPVQQVKTQAQIFLHHLVQLAAYITKAINLYPIHFCLTGGATASAIVRHLNNSRLQVKEEIAPGVVTLTGHTNRSLYTVKPGSYPWPPSFLESLLPNKTDAKKATDFRN